MKSITIQRLTPRVQVPEFLKVDRETELRELREKVQALEAEVASLKKASTSINADAIRALEALP